MFIFGELVRINGKMEGKVLHFISYFYVLFDFFHRAKYIPIFLSLKKYSDPVIVHNPPTASHLTLSKSLSHSDGPKGSHDLTLSSAISYPISFLAILSLIPSAPATLVFSYSADMPARVPPQDFCPCCFSLPLKLFLWLTPSLSLSFTSSAIFSVRFPLPLSYLELQLLISLSLHPA